MASSPPFGMHPGVHGPRILAAALSLSATGALMVLFRVSHPPAGATTLIVSLGIIAQPKELVIIEVAVFCLRRRPWLSIGLPDYLTLFGESITRQEEHCRSKLRKAVRGTMITPDADSTAEASVNANGTVASSSTAPPARPDEPTKAKNQNIRVSPAVLDAARKDGEELLRSLRTATGGLTQTEAEETRAHGGPE